MLARPSSKWKKKWEWFGIPVIPEGLQSSQPGQKARPRAKSVGGMAQAVERLPSKCEALSSNSIVSREREREREREESQVFFKEEKQCGNYMEFVLSYCC
jgi:hypothetical protein